MPAQTGRTRLKPLHAGLKKRILPPSTPHLVAGCESLNTIAHLWQPRRIRCHSHRKRELTCRAFTGI